VNLGHLQFRVFWGGRVCGVIWRILIEFLRISFYFRLLG
jgi:hypothetical protein